jgi:hypothetical protein
MVAKRAARAAKDKAKMALILATIIILIGVGALVAKIAIGVVEIKMV